jgi:hypothetical protein
MELPTPIDLTKAHAHARAVVATINHDVAPHRTFVKASQNVADHTPRNLAYTLHRQGG